MKRGLVHFDPRELGAGELEARVSRLQQTLRTEGIAAALIYGDVYHSGDITYLTNLCIYWNEGVFLVPVSGQPILLSKLSSRVHPWMKATSNLKEMRSGNNIADLLVKTLGSAAPGTIGMVEMEWWPGVLVDEIQEKLPGWDVRDLGPVVRREREHPSGTELSLLRESAAVSARALESGSDKALTQAQRRGRAELTARLSGVEDVYVFCDPATSEADTLEVFSEYRGYWTAAARVIAKGSPPWAPALARAYAAAERTLSPGVNRNRVSAAVEQALAGESIRWRLDLMDHTDLETRGDYRSRLELEGLVDEGAVAGLRLELTLRDGSRAVAADTYRIAQGGAERLTRDLPPAVLN